MLRQMMGQNPQAGAMMAAAQAHIAEHMAFAYRQRVEQAMGAALPPPDTILPEEVEMEMSRLAAMASEIVLGQSKAEVAAQQAQQAAQDPITQIQQRELAIKEAEVQRKKQKDITDAAAKADEIDLERDRLSMEAELKGLQVGVDIAKSRTDQQIRAQIDAMRTGVDMAREAKNQPQPPQPPTGATE
jgi:dsDNA-specific endonuclease/ATPase MutS2